MKKIIAIYMAIIIIFAGLQVFASNADVSLLSTLSIMNGDGNGNFRLDDMVSRAEFAKLTVASSSYRNSVAVSLRTSSYKDVPASHWAAPYIKVAVENGFCKGYTDATFRPDNTVTYEEAVTMTLKVLGYTDDDFGISWPYGQVGLAENLSLTQNMNAEIGTQLSRRQVASLIYNSLDTKIKDSAQKLISVFDSKTIENVVLIASNREDGSVGGDKLYTSEGTFKYTSNFDTSNIGKRGDIFIKNDDELLSFTPYTQSIDSYTVTLVSGGDMIFDGKLLGLDEGLTVYYKSQKTTYENAVPLAKSGDIFSVYRNANGNIDYAVLIPSNNNSPIDIHNLEKHIVYSFLDSSAVTYCNDMMNTLTIPDITPFYQDTAKSTYSAQKSIIEMGDILHIKRKSSGDIEYVTYEKGNVAGPTTVTSQTDLSQYSGSKIMRNGTSVDISEINSNDIIYYIRDLNMLLAYSNKVTGIYERAEPNKDAPISVIISGVSYKIEGSAAFSKLSSNGGQSLNFGDAVTLLLGKTNQIADVSTTIAANNEIYGYLYETGTKEYQKSDLSTYTGQYIKIALLDSQISEYIADRDYKSSKNSVVKITFSNGVAKANVVRSDFGISGKFDWISKKIGNANLSSNVKILDISTLDSTVTGAYASIFPSRMDWLSISGNSVLLADKNEKNEIVSLILNNATGDVYSYGMVLKSESRAAGMSVSGSYTYDIGGVSKSFNTSGISYSIISGQAAKFTFTESGSVQSMQAISKIENNITDITYLSLTAGNTKYPMSDKVVVYKKDYNYNYNYTIIPLSEITNNKEYNITAYYDKSPSTGGMVRVIVATAK